MLVSREQECHMTTDYSLSRSPDELFNPWRRAQGNLQNKENTFLLILQHYIFPPSSTTCGHSDAALSEGGGQRAQEKPWLCLVWCLVSCDLVTMMVSLPVRAMASVCPLQPSDVQYTTLHYLLYYAVTHIMWSCTPQLRINRISYLLSQD